MHSDDTDRTSPISEVNNRLVPPQSVARAKTVGIDARLGQARRTFASLVATSADPPLQQRTEFEVSGLPKLRTGTLQNFYLQDETSAQRAGFTVSFEYLGRENIKHVCASEVLYNTLRKTLYAHGLKFRSVAAETVYRLEVEARVPAYVMIAGAPQGRILALTLRNVGRLGSITYELPVEALERKLVDALVELVVSGSSDFYALIAKTGARRD